MISDNEKHDRCFPVRLTLAQRIAVAEVFPDTIRPPRDLTNPTSGRLV